MFLPNLDISLNEHGRLVDVHGVISKTVFKSFKISQTASSGAPSRIKAVICEFLNLGAMMPPLFSARNLRYSTLNCVNQLVAAVVALASLMP